MRRLLRLSPFALVLAVLLSVGVVLAALHSTQQVGGAASSNKPAPGVGAIAPSLPGHLPAFTESDVRAYLAQYPFKPTTAGVAPRITKIVFIPREQAEAAMGGESLAGQVAPGGLVCYVEFAGPFNVLQGESVPGSLSQVVGPGTPTPVRVPPQEIAQTGHLVFDASTGNLLVVGYGN